MKRRMESTLRAWKSLSLRERYLLICMALLLLFGLLYSLLWQPTQQRLAGAERLYQQQWVLSRRVLLAQPQQETSVATQPLPARLSERATAAGLDLHQMEVDGDQLRLSISGEAHALLSWLADLERDGTPLLTLTLQKREQRLEARVVL